MVLKRIARGQQTSESFRAVFNFEHPVAGAAKKMVVVGLRRYFPAWRLTGKVNLRDDTIGLKAFQVPVDSSNAQAGDFLPGKSEYLIHG